MVNYRLSVYKRHAIYYQVDGAGVVIVRILRNQNVAGALEVYA